MKRVWVRNLNHRVGLGALCFVFVTALAAVALAGHHEGSDAHDKAKNADAADPDGVNGTATPIFGSIPGPVETITPEVGKGMLAEFQRAQSAELKALDHRNKLEIKELKTSQGIRQKEWEKREKDSRHRSFAEHTRGPDRRAYIKDFLERHRAFLQQLKDESVQRAQEQDARIAALRDEQSERLKQFKEALGRNERPAAHLWPGSA